MSLRKPDISISTAAPVGCSSSRVLVAGACQAIVAKVAVGEAVLPATGKRSSHGQHFEGGMIGRDRAYALVARFWSDAVEELGNLCLPSL